MVNNIDKNWRFFNNNRVHSNKDPVCNTPHICTLLMHVYITIYTKYPL